MVLSRPGDLLHDKGQLALPLFANRHGALSRGAQITCRIFQYATLLGIEILQVFMQLRVITDDSCQRTPCQAGFSGEDSCLLVRIGMPCQGQQYVQGFRNNGVLAGFQDVPHSVCIRFDGIELVPPSETFSGCAELRVGSRRVELLEVGPAHTRGDVMAFVPDARTVFTGDLLFAEAHPLIWEGPMRNWIAACSVILQRRVEVVVPGHGPVCGPEIFDDMEKWLILYQDLRLRYAGRYGIKDMPPENREKMIEEMKAEFPDWVEGDLDVSCGKMLAPPYSYGKNMYSVAQV